MVYWIFVIAATLVIAACGRTDTTPTPTPNPEPVTFAITAPFDSRAFTPDTTDDAPRVDAGESIIHWYPVPGAARYDVWILDRSNTATSDNPVPGEVYSQGSTDDTRWRVSFAANADDAGHAMSVEISAYDAGGHLIGYTGRFVFVVT